MRSVIGYLVCLFVGLTIVFTFLPRPEAAAADDPLRADRVQVNALLDLDTRVLAEGERGELASATRLAGHGTLTSAVMVGSRLLLGGERGVFDASAGNLATLGK